MMFARLADGTWVVGPHGTVVETSHTPATAVIDGRVRGGMLTEVLARPPAALETVRSAPASRKRPWEYAVQAGVMTPQAASAAAAAPRTTITPPPVGPQDTIGQLDPDSRAHGDPIRGVEP